MKKIYAALLLPIVLPAMLSGQGLVSLRDTDGNPVNGTLIHAASQPSDNTNEVDVLAELTGTNATQVNVRRYEVWPVAGTSNYFCWGVCYISVPSGINSTWVSQHHVDMTPDVEVNNFHAYYQPTGNAGTARFRYVWFDTANPTGADSSWVDIEFGGAVGLNERTGLSTSLEAWPNPSNGSDLLINYSVDHLAQGTEIVLYNVLGERVRRQSVNAVQGRATIATAGLGSGVYFANIERNGRMLATRRVVVTR